MRFAAITPSSRNGTNKARAFDLPEPFGPRSTRRPSAHSKTWSSYSQMLRMPARLGRHRSSDTEGLRQLHLGAVASQRREHQQGAIGASADETEAGQQRDGLGAQAIGILAVFRREPP